MQLTMDKSNASIEQLEPKVSRKDLMSGEFLSSATGGDKSAEEKRTLMLPNIIKMSNADLGQLAKLDAKSRQQLVKGFSKSINSNR